jgi:hypothetical protein
MAFLLKAQDPELLMNEFRAISITGQKQQLILTNESFSSIGINTGASISLLNLYVANFNKKRFRIGDLIGADIGMGYSTNPIVYNIWLYGRTEIGLQGYYALNQDLDIGIKLYDLFNTDLNANSNLIITQPIVRVKKLVFETKLGLENNSTNKHYQSALKYIVNDADVYKAIVIRYEYVESKEHFQTNYLSIGYTQYFASNR